MLRRAPSRRFPFGLNFISLRWLGSVLLLSRSSRTLGYSFSYLQLRFVRLPALDWGRDITGLSVERGVEEVLPLDPGSLSPSGNQFWFQFLSFTFSHMMMMSLFTPPLLLPCSEPCRAVPCPVECVLFEMKTLFKPPIRLLFMRKIKFLAAATDCN